MHITRLRQLFSLLAITVGLSTLFLSNASAMHRAPSGATEEESKSFKDLVTERGLARDRARDRLLEMSKQVGDASVTVKIRHKGDDEEAGSRGQVVAETKMTKEEYSKTSPSELYSKVKASAGATVIDRPAATSRHTHDMGPSDRERTAIWYLAGFMGLALLGWWYIRRIQPI